MKKILYILLMFYGVNIVADADISTATKRQVTRGNVQIIEATENIRYVSQKLSKEYLFFFLNPENEKIQKDLYSSLDILSKNLRAISVVSKDQDTQDILEFLAYSKEEISNILGNKPTKDKALLMLDYSETLLEGADSIAKTYAYKFSNEEKMLVLSKNIKFLIERISKYYIALHLGYDIENNRDKMKQAILSLKDGFINFDNYFYPEKLQPTERLLSNLLISDIWIVNKNKEYFIPSLLLDSVSFFEDKMDILALYHSKNL